MARDFRTGHRQSQRRGKYVQPSGNIFGHTEREIGNRRLRRQKVRPDLVRLQIRRTLLLFEKRFRKKSHKEQPSCIGFNPQQLDTGPVLRLSKQDMDQYGT